VTRDDGVRVHFGDRVEGRLHGVHIVVEEGHQLLRAGRGAERMASDEGVAAEQHPGTGHQVGGVPAGVPGRRDRDGPTGDVDDVPCADDWTEIRGLGHTGVVQRPVAHHVQGPRQHTWTPQVAGHIRRAGLFQVLPSRMPRFRGRQQDRHPMLLEQTRQRADVVDVRMGDEHGLDVAEAAADLADRGEDVVEVPRPPGVDQREGVALGDERPVDGLALDGEDARRDLGDFHRMDPTRTGAVGTVDHRSQQE
jgi:hypothetical protein